MGTHFSQDSALVVSPPIAEVVATAPDRLLQTIRVVSGLTHVVALFEPLRNAVRKKPVLTPSDKPIDYVRTWGTKSSVPAFFAVERHYGNGYQHTMACSSLRPIEFRYWNFEASALIPHQLPKSESVVFTSPRTKCRWVTEFVGASFLQQGVLTLGRFVFNDQMLLHSTVLTIVIARLAGSFELGMIVYEYFKTPALRKGKKKRLLKIPSSSFGDRVE